MALIRLVVGLRCRSVKFLRLKSVFFTWICVKYVSFCYWLFTFSIEVSPCVTLCDIATSNKICSILVKICLAAKVVYDLTTLKLLFKVVLLRKNDKQMESEIHSLCLYGFPMTNISDISVIISIYLL